MFLIFSDFFPFSISYLNVKIQMKQNQIATTNLFISCNVSSAAAPIFKESIFL